MYRPLPQQLSHPVDGATPDYINRWLGVYKTVISETGYPGTENIQNFSQNDMNRLHKELLGLPLLTSWLDYYQVLENTVQYWRADNEVQRIAQNCAIRRLGHLLGALARRHRLGRSTFTAWGWQHVYAIKHMGVLGQFGTITQFEP